MDVLPLDVGPYTASPQLAVDSQRMLEEAEAAESHCSQLDLLSSLFDVQIVS